MNLVFFHNVSNELILFSLSDLIFKVDVLLLLKLTFVGVL